MGNNSARGFGFNTGGGGGGGGTDTNIANSNLVSDGNYNTDLNGNNLQFKNGTSRILQMDSSTSSVTIGNSTPYTMPTARSGAIGQVLQSTDVTKGMDWKSAGYSLPFTMYYQGVDSENYFFPEPMSNNKFLAITRKSGLSDPASWNVLTSSTVRSCTLGMANKQVNISSLDFWASSLDNGGNLFPKIKVEIWKFNINEGVTTQLVPESVVSAETNATGDSNNKFYQAKGIGGTGVGDEIAATNLIMPVFRLNYDGIAPAVINVDVWINGTVHFYYS